MNVVYFALCTFSTMRDGRKVANFLTVFVILFYVVMSFMSSSYRGPNHQRGVHMIWHFSIFYDILYILYILAFLVWGQKNVG